MASASVDLPESPVNESCEEDVSLDDSIYVPTPERHLQIKLKSSSISESGFHGHG